MTSWLKSAKLPYRVLAYRSHCIAVRRFPVLLCVSGCCCLRQLKQKKYETVYCLRFLEIGEDPTFMRELMRAFLPRRGRLQGAPPVREDELTIPFFTFFFVSLSLLFFPPLPFYREGRVGEVGQSAPSLFCFFPLPPARLSLFL